jgi:hypothetical protein
VGVGALSFSGGESAVTNTMHQIDQFIAELVSGQGQGWILDWYGVLGVGLWVVVERRCGRWGVVGFDVGMQSALSGVL